MAQQSETFVPEEGQPGKDVMWLPTPSSLVSKMLDMAKVKPSDYLIDLGSGDGINVITAARRGLNALGIEYNPKLVELSKRRAAQAGVSDKASFVKADIFKSDFSRASVVFMFLLPELNMRLRPKLLGLKPGTRIVSNSFTLGDWKADQFTEIEKGCAERNAIILEAISRKAKAFVENCVAYLWVVPARFGGIWKAADLEVRLGQKFQMISGTVRTGNVVAPIKNGKITGRNIHFVAGGIEYSATLSRSRLRGTAKSKIGTKEWLAALSTN